MDEDSFRIRDLVAERGRCSPDRAEGLARMSESDAELERLGVNIVPSLDVPS